MELSLEKYMRYFISGTKRRVINRPTKYLDLSVRTYVCEHCGLVLDRDRNAALNLRWLYTASTAEIDACGEFVSPRVLALVAVSKKQEMDSEEDSA